MQVAVESGEKLREVSEIKDAKVGTPNEIANKSDSITEEKLPGWGDFESDDESDDEWITPENSKPQPEIEQICSTTACATCDFSMQNVLLALGLNVIARDGMLVKEIRSWALRCATCWHITHDMSKVFCPSCGHRQLKRVPFTIDESGEKRYFLSKSKNPKCLNLRGTIYDYKRPQGGKHCTDHITREGQKVTFDKMSKKAMRRQNLLNEDMDDPDNPFFMKDVSSRSVFRGNARSRGKVIPTEHTAQQLRMNVGWGNNRKKTKGKKK